jgi:lipoprotein NlpI
MIIKKFNESQDSGNELEMYLADLKKLGFEVKDRVLQGLNHTSIRATKRDCDFNASVDAYKSLYNKLESSDKYTFINNSINFNYGTCRISIDLKNK